MNTALDINKTLCLASAERIKLPSTLHLVFEVQDLKAASPATVSRCGMVYMEQMHVGMTSLIRSWGSTVLREMVRSFSMKSNSIINTKMLFVLSLKIYFTVDVIIVINVFYLLFTIYNVYDLLLLLSILCCLIIMSIYEFFLMVCRFNPFQCQIGGKAAKGVVLTIESHLERAVDFIRYECTEHVRTSNNQLAAELLNLFEGHLLSDEDPKVKQKEKITRTLAIELPMTNSS